mmetsp:Transcript_72249/g.223236  ORF Transcript_72249/g.223236 Transcript_72249/m.223236 type:complete len:141 (-) Transcript_72249:25-447(-)
MALCPCCLDHLPAVTSRKKVVFLCGHSFHFRCLNKCYKASDKIGLCPVCDGASAQGAPPPGEMGDMPPCDGGPDDAGAPASGQPPLAADEAHLFILQTLQRQYPDIVSEECVRRWASRHTEIWLSELERPSRRCLLQLVS